MNREKKGPSKTSTMKQTNSCLLNVKKKKKGKDVLGNINEKWSKKKKNRWGHEKKSVRCFNMSNISCQILRRIIFFHFHFLMLTQFNNSHFFSDSTSVVLPENSNYLFCSVILWVMKMRGAQLCILGVLCNFSQAKSWSAYFMPQSPGFGNFFW